MQEVLTPKEAVRLAKETLGETTAKDMAAFIQENFGLTILPPIVTVLLGAIQERAALDHTGQVAYEKIQQWREENPEEAKKLAAAARRREAAKRKKAEAKESLGSILPAEVPADPVAPEVSGAATLPETKDVASDERVRILVTSLQGAHSQNPFPAMG
jgi:hypothetical protein